MDTSKPQPFLGLCTIFRDNIDTLPALLASVAGHFDHYSFTDTGSKDGSRELVEAFLQTHRGVLTDFEWVDDFAKARNFNFSHSPARWKFFLDSDDQLVGGEKVRPLLLKVEAQHPQIEAFFVNYDYDKLEELPTMRLARVRDGWGFNDAIHERLEFIYPGTDEEGLPEKAYGRTGEFHLFHKRKSPEEKAAAIRRNTRIAEREYAATTDQKYRARLARTLAMELKMDGRGFEAIPLWAELWKDYSAYPEGRQAAADCAKAYQYRAETGNPTPEEREAWLLTGLEWAKRAGPAYEGMLLFSLKDYEGVLRAAQRSMGRGQQATHEGYIFEQGVIYISASAAAARLGKHADVVEHILNRVPAKLRNDPSVLEHINGIRHEVDRITILVPGTPQPFDENGGGGMLGGSEEAVVYLSRALAQAGRNVRVYGVLPPHRLPGPDRFGVDWQDAGAFDIDKEHGTLVLWRAPGVLLRLMQEAGKRGGPLPGVVQAYLWLHDSGLGIDPRLAETVSHGADAVVLSEFHERMIRRAGYTGRCIRLTNGIVREDFEPFIAKRSFGFTEGGRERNSVVYSSCPSRGLVQLLTMWPAVKAAVPDAKLDIYYDWSMLEAMQPEKYDEVSKLYAGVQHLSVTHHGGVDHATLHAALRRANVWAYSHFESPEVETSCISSMKALAAGATVLTVPNGALPETVGSAGYFATSPEQYQKDLIDLLKSPEGVRVRREKARAAVAFYSWDVVAKGFSDLWTVRRKIVLDAPEAVAKVSE
jgi:glycosyltransferase involved in cell wall biosynthesis